VERLLPDGPAATMMTMTPEPLWEVRNGVDMHTLCFVTAIDGTYLLLVRRDDEVVVLEPHGGPSLAMERANAIYRQLVERGWMTVDS
jgi:hypothetical protein